MRRQEEAVTFLEAETKQLLQWKAEHQKKLKERTLLAKGSSLKAP
jgi:hypothetical protein